MKSSVYIQKNPWIIAVLLPILTFAYWSFGNFTIFSSFIITVLVLVSSTFLSLPFSNVQAHKEEQSHEQEDYGLVSSDQKNSNQVDDEAKIGFSEIGFPESISSNEIIDRFSSTSGEDSDFDCRRFPSESPDYSDDDSLIEIELPARNYAGLKGGERGQDDDEKELCFEKLSPDISPELICRWSEMNEEENLIEIDISMGSII